MEAKQTASYCFLVIFFCWCRLKAFKGLPHDGPEIPQLSSDSERTKNVTCATRQAIVIKVIISFHAYIPQTAAFAFYIESESEG